MLDGCGLLHFPILIGAPGIRIELALLVGIREREAIGTGTLNELLLALP